MARPYCHPVTTAKPSGMWSHYCPRCKRTSLTNRPGLQQTCLVDYSRRELAMVLRIRGVSGDPEWTARLNQDFAFAGRAYWSPAGEARFDGPGTAEFLVGFQFTRQAMTVTLRLLPELGQATWQLAAGWDAPRYRNYSLPLQQYAEQVCTFADSTVLVL